MIKQISRVAALTGAVMLLTSAALAQKSTSKLDQIPGFYNPKTHTFQARVVPEADPDATAPKTYTGTLKFDITVKLVTPVASGQELVCTTTALVEDENGSGGFYEESASGIGKVSGSTGTCTIDIPYSWNLSAATSDSVDISYNLEIIPTSSNAIVDYTTRTHTSELLPIKVPATGATTAIPVSATI